MGQKIGIFGGTFNPVHYGHLAAAEEVRDRLKLERILFVPSFLPPHKQEEDMPSAVQRLEMVRLAISGNNNFRVSDLEVKRGGKSYTIETIEALLQQYLGSELTFITGLDSFLEIRTWKEWERLLSLCGFAVLSRPGYRFIDLAAIPGLDACRAELEMLDRNEKDHVALRTDTMRVSLDHISLYDISSTDIRARVKKGRTIKYHLPDAVEHYIIENKLYA